MLETENLCKAFGRRAAVRGLNVSIQRGEIFAFVGPNGAGKTTTLRMLTTLLKPDRGTIRLNGIDLIKEPHKALRFIGYVSQAGGADRFATGREDLLLQAKLYGLKDAKQRVEEVLTMFGLGDLADRLVGTYSGGEKRRLDLALGIIHRPDMLFLDEPTANLDPHHRDLLWAHIRRLQQDGTTILFSSHYLDEVHAVSSRIATMEDGCLQL